MNPIYIDYYSHENCDCYKIDIPWTCYAQDIRVLCRVDEGIETARCLAIGIIIKYLIEILEEDINACQNKNR
jgi:hypothetical protein